MAKIAKSVLRYRARAGRGKIMRPSTFASIQSSAAGKGYRNPAAVAGAAYWKTAKAKARKARRGK